MTLRKVTIDNCVRYVCKTVNSQSEEIPLYPSMSNKNSRRVKTLKNVSNNNN